MFICKRFQPGTQPSCKDHCIHSIPVLSCKSAGNSSLKGKPIAVGGQSDRGVIASCSYEASKFGVRSAMPVKLARRLCPELKIIKGDGDSYSKFSRQVTDIIASETPLFEKSSIDEFYIDMRASSSGLDWSKGNLNSNGRSRKSRLSVA